MSMAGGKRKATASETDVPAKRSTCAVLPEEAAAVLRTISSSLNTTTLALMALPTTDVTALGRVVADLAEYTRQLNDLLGIKRRGTSVLAISDTILDVFQFVRRQELDTLQIVNRRFSEIVEKKLTLLCLRLLRSAKISRCSAKNEFVLVMDEVGAVKKTHLPTSVDNEAAATMLLFNACRSSSIDDLQLYGTTPMDADFFDSLALSAPIIFLKEFCTGKRTLADDVEDRKVLQALQAFAELKTVKIESFDAGNDTNLQGCLIRTCFKAGVDLVSDALLFGAQFYITNIENALLEF